MSNSQQRHTFLGWQIFQVNHDGEVVAWFRGRYVVAIFALKDLLGAVLNQVGKASYLDGQLDLGLGFRRRDVECYAVKVGDGLVNRGWRSTISKSVSRSLW